MFALRAEIAGAVQWPNTRAPAKDAFWMEAAADLAAEVLADADLDHREVDGVFFPPIPEGG
jgi:hypothetical protein